LTPPAAWPPPCDTASLLSLAALAAALLIPPIVAYEPAWEVAAGLGYAGCGAAIAVFAVPPAPRPNLTPYRFALHRVAGNALLVLALLHVAVMTACDPFMLDYLGWMMPSHVLLGVLALLALALATATREPWLRRRLPLPSGARWHAWSGVAGGTLLAAHVLTSSSRLTASWRTALLALALLLPPLAGTAAMLVRRPAAAMGEPFAAGRAGRHLLLALLALFALLAGVPALVRGLRG
jgi:hypothetical protein